MRIVSLHRAVSTARTVNARKLRGDVYKIMAHAEAVEPGSSGAATRGRRNCHPGITHPRYLRRTPAEMDCTVRVVWSVGWVRADWSPRPRIRRARSGFLH